MRRIHHPARAMEVAMAAKYEVKVAPGYRWETARVAGRQFSKRAVTTLAEHEMNDEIARAASAEYGILAIRVVKPPAAEDAAEDAPDYSPLVLGPRDQGSGASSEGESGASGEDAPDYSSGASDEGAAAGEVEDGG